MSLTRWLWDDLTRQIAEYMRRVKVEASPQGEKPAKHPWYGEKRERAVKESV